MNKKSIKEIKHLLQIDELTEAQIRKLRNDERKGVQQLIRSYDRKMAKIEFQKIEHKKLKQFDEQYIENAQTIIAGIDEAGRGPLAGPVVSAAVILPKSFECIGLTESKQLTEAERNEFFNKIINQAIDYSVSIIDNLTIDRLNILEATKQSMEKALLQLTPRPHIALIDAVAINVEHIKTMSINKGDEKSLSIAAASIIAKVTRDRLMNTVHEQYPHYDFKNNKGYGSKNHLAALKKYGPSPLHRKTFAPVRNVLNA